jgi:hypothetical protein
MDELRKTSGGLYSRDTVPPEHQEEILRVTREWDDETSIPEVYWS